MRRNQVSITLERYGNQAPVGAARQHVTAYADANEVWEALAAAFYKISQEIQRDQPLPSFGRVEGHTRNIVNSPGGAEPGDREAKIQAWVEQNREYAEKYSARPQFSPEWMGWAVFADEKLEVGKPSYVAGKWLGTPLRYRYCGYCKKTFTRWAEAVSIEEVVDSLLYAPEKFSIDGHEEDYSTQEIAMLRALQEKLLNEK